MILPALLLSALGLLLAPASALPVFYRGQYLSQGAPLDTQLAAAEDPYAKSFQQRVDHFDRSNLDTFPQRYFINDTFWKGPESNAPVFLCVGGEGPPLTYMVLIASDHCNDMVMLAEQHGALMLALEHRYYGPSVPTPDFSTENMRFLNSEQAVADIAYFHSYISDMLSLTAANKWVSWGGSYPGMMASFARLRYPHLFHAAVASSAPVKASTDMPEYNNIVADSIAATSVGGSQECLNIVVSGHQAIGELLKTREGRKTLSSKFNLCNEHALENENNQKVFAGNGVVYIPAQSNDPACAAPLCNIAKICTFLLDEAEGEPIDRLAALASAQSGGMCTPANYEAQLRVWSNPKNTGRAWLYQTCNEWGFYQTCEKGTKCPYVQGLHTLDWDYDICQTAFDISPDSVNYNTKFANSMYGGDNPQSSRIFYVNGIIDPWYGLSVLSPPNDQEPTLMVEGASHHYWTHAAEPTDDENIVAAREAIFKQVSAWLQESP